MIVKTNKNTFHYKKVELKPKAIMDLRNSISSLYNRDGYFGYAFTLNSSSFKEYDKTFVTSGVFVSDLDLLDSSYEYVLNFKDNLFYKLLEVK